MFSTSPMKKTLAYDQPSCQLRVEGLPDLSAGQGSDELGILTRWTLRWVGRPELEGERDHLEALIGVVLPYARHLVSGVRRGFGDGPVRISPGEGSTHTLQLVSRQPGTPSLDLSLDDAELADLVRALDRLRLDPRLHLVREVVECAQQLAGVPDVGAGEPEAAALGHRVLANMPPAAYCMATEVSPNHSGSV